MNETSMVQIVALVGWLVLAGSALASYKLNFGKAVRMALIWSAIFVGLYLLFDIVGPSY